MLFVLSSKKETNITLGGVKMNVHRKNAGCIWFETSVLLELDYKKGEINRVDELEREENSN